MILENYGVAADLVEVDASGRLHINLTTDRDLRLTVNDQPMRVDASSPPSAFKFWGPDGKQTDVAPPDLRGEER
jgi:hypothetical protein